MYVRITFKDAKLVYEHPKKRKDKDGNEIELTEEELKHYVTADNIIRFYPVANMLHAFFEEIPIPSLRKTGLSKSCRQKWIDDIASTCIYKIYNKYTKTTKDGRTIPIYEITMGSPKAYNSHATSLYTESSIGTFKGIISWYELKRMQLKKGVTYETIVSNIEKWLGIDDITTKKNLPNSIIALKGTEYEEDAIKFFNDIRLKPLADIITKGLSAKTQSLNHCFRGEAAKYVTSTQTKKIVLNGEFIFNMTQEQYNKLLWGRRWVTYLDGGIASCNGPLDGPIDYVDIDFSEYTKLENNGL